MPTFRYVAFDRTGRTVNGQVVADNESAALAQVKAQGLYPREMRLAESDGRLPTRPTWGRRKVRPTDLAVFSRQFATLVNGGLPILRSLEAMIEHTENPALREALQQVHEEVRGGAILHESMAKRPEAFPELFVSMVRAGEASGQLGTVLKWLADFQEREQERRSQVRSALMYPALLIIVGSIAVFVLVTFFIPRFATIFEELDQALPALTQTVIGISRFFGHWWWAILLGLLGSRMLLRWYSRTPNGRYRLDTLKLRLPLWGGLVRKIAVARFARTLATLLRGGVPILEALEVVRDVVGNERIGRAIDQVRQRVREGESLAAECRATGLFPALLTHMMAVGEETGNLENVLEAVANAYDVEVDNTMRGLISLLEPVIILTMGALIGIVVFSMLLPIFQMRVSLGQ